MWEYESKKNGRAERPVQGLGTGRRVTGLMKSTLTRYLHNKSWVHCFSHELFEGGDKLDILGNGRRSAEFRWNSLSLKGVGIVRSKQPS